MESLNEQPSFFGSHRITWQKPYFKIFQFCGKVSHCVSYTLLKRGLLGRRVGRTRTSYAQVCKTEQKGVKLKITGRQVYVKELCYLLLVRTLCIHLDE